METVPFQNVSEIYFWSFHYNHNPAHWRSSVWCVIELQINQRSGDKHFFFLLLERNATLQVTESLSCVVYIPNYLSKHLSPTAHLSRPVRGQQRSCWTCWDLPDCTEHQQQHTQRHRTNTFDTETQSHDDVVINIVITKWHQVTYRHKIVINIMKIHLKSTWSESVVMCRWNRKESLRVTLLLRWTARTDWQLDHASYWLKMVRIWLCTLHDT